MPFPDGWEPDDDHDRGVSDEEFASVVFDEAFVRAATVHEPTAVERLLAAAQARAEASEAEARRAHATGELYDEGHRPGGRRFRGGDRDLGDHDDRDDRDDHDGFDGLDDPDGRHGLFGSYGGKLRWHRPVAWLLAVVMGVGMVALAFAAVYRGGASGSRDQVPLPAPTGLERGSAAAPSVTAAPARPTVPATLRSP